MNHKWIGSSHDDFYFIKDDVTIIRARKGDDTIVSHVHQNIVADGGFGFDIFELWIKPDYTYDTVIHGHSSVVKIHAPDGSLFQKVVLSDFEVIELHEMEHRPHPDDGYSDFYT